MSGADGVSFVESLPRQFVVGKTGLVLVAVQGAPGTGSCSKSVTASNHVIKYLPASNPLANPAL